MGEDIIKFIRVGVYSNPRLFGGRKTIDNKYQVGSTSNLGIIWGGSTR